MTRAFLLFVSMIVAALAANPAWAQQPQPNPVDVTVTVMRYVEIENPDPASGPGDYYAGVCWPQKGGEPDCPLKPDIGPLMERSNVFADNDPDVEPFATITQRFDKSDNPLKFELTVWDFDPGILQGGDDVMDINPNDDSVSLTILLDVTTGAWTEFNGAIPANVGFAEGDGDTGLDFFGPGGEAGKILFDISLSDDGDGDDDGIPDGVERTAVRDVDGNLVANMATLGADPCRKTIATEIDFMETQGVGHSHRPQPGAIAELKQAFEAAPVAPRSDCPYPGFPSGDGVNLITHVDDPLPEQAALGTSQSDACKNGLDNARRAFFHTARRRYFHYALSAHDLVPNDSTSGVYCGGSPDFIVSLGSWTNQVGSVREQSGTFMHELGHALGLGHGGIDSVNYKPNYLSVMNYSFSATGIFELAGGTRLDYSQQALASLDETNLDENAGIGGGTDFTRFYDPADTARWATGNAAIDWNWSTQGAPPFQASVPADVNGDTTCVRFGRDGASDTTRAGDDVLVGNPVRAIRVGPNRVCESRANSNPSPQPSPVDDRQVTAASFPCVLPGADGELQTTQAPGDELRSSPAGLFISYASNLTCNSTAAASSDDVQATPVGQSVPTIALAGFDDWSSLRYASGLGSIGTSFAQELHADITHEEAAEIAAFWQDAMTVPSVSLIGAATLTGAVTAIFSEPVGGVTGDNLVLRVAGANANLAAAVTCHDTVGGQVDCASSVVRTAVLQPTQPLVPGEYYLAVAAPTSAPSAITDSAGNAVQPTSGQFRGSVVEDETSVAARYTWQELSRPVAYGGSYATEHLQGASASFTFVGSSATWYTVTGPNQGLAHVHVDGTHVQTVDQYSPTMQYRVPRQVGGLAWGEHTLTIKVAGVASPAGVGTFVSIDAIVVNDAELLVSPPFRYTWQPSTVFEDVTGRRYVRADLRGAGVSFTFRASGITWFTVKGPDQGQADVWVDGVKWATVDNHAAAHQYGVPVKVTGLTDAVHTLRISVPANGAFVSVDGWRVQ
jgi:hypothetical protein